jgi:hypothetical protein
MPYLASAVVAVGALGLVNLLLTLAVIRRLRQHTELLSDRPAGPDGSVLAVGERPANFAAVDTDGRAVTVGPDGPRLVGFFSPECQPCKAKLPDFVAQVTGYPGGRERVLAVVAGDGPGSADFSDALIGVARVVVEPSDGPLTAAFQVSGFPSWCVLDEHGVVQHSAVGLDRLPVPVAP